MRSAAAIASRSGRPRGHPARTARAVALAASLAATGGVAGLLAFVERTPGSAGGGADTGSAGLVDGVWTGSLEQIRWGGVQVSATVVDGELVTVELLRAPDDRRSAAINARADTVLAAEAVEEQGAQLDVVSGATYTSRAYAASLQQALDAAGAAGETGS